MPLISSDAVSVECKIRIVPFQIFEDDRKNWHWSVIIKMISITFLFVPVYSGQFNIKISGDMINWHIPLINIAKKWSWLELCFRDCVTFHKKDGSMHLINNGSYHTIIASNLPSVVSFTQNGGLKNRFETSGYWWTSSTITLLLRWDNMLHVIFFHLQQICYHLSTSISKALWLAFITKLTLLTNSILKSCCFYADFKGRCADFMSLHNIPENKCFNGRSTKCKDIANNLFGGQKLVTISRSNGFVVGSTIPLGKCKILGKHKGNTRIWHLFLVRNVLPITTN